MRRSLVWFIFLPFLFRDCLADQDNSTRLELKYSQNNRTYIWNNGLDFSHMFDGKIEISLLSRINSTLIRSSTFSGGGDRWQEDGGLRIGLGYPLKRNLDVGFRFNQDMNSLATSKITTDNWSLVSQLKWGKAILSQEVGIKKIERKNEQGKFIEQGGNYDLGIAMKPVLPGGTLLDISLTQNSTTFKRIPTIERKLELALCRRMNPQDTIRAFYREGWSKKKYYAVAGPAQTTTQKRNIRTLNWISSKEMIGNFRLDLRLDYSLNRYRYLLEEDSLSFPYSLKDNANTSKEIYVQLRRGNPKGIEGSVFYKYIGSLDEYWDKRRNQKTETAEAGANLHLSFSSSDSLLLIGSMGVTSIFGLSTVNYSDRDVLLKMVNLEHIHIFSPFLTLRTKVGFRNFHQLYISERLSDNNNYNETYILAPSVEYRPHPKVSLKQDFSIQANYISYDYRKEEESTDNRIFRRASWSSELKYSPSHTLDLAGGYLYRYEDYGQLLWKDQWVQKPSWDRRTQRMRLGCDYHMSKQLIFSPDYTYEIIKEWDHLWASSSESQFRQLSEKLIHNVLSFSVSYNVSTNNFLEVSSSTQFQKKKGGSEDRTDFFYVSLVQFF